MSLAEAVCDRVPAAALLDAASQAEEAQGEQKKRIKRKRKRKNNRKEKTKNEKISVLAQLCRQGHTRLTLIT